MGLNTCWTALTYKKVPEAFRLEPGEKLVIVIAAGYGNTQGVPHKSRPLEQLSETPLPDAPAWYREGIEAAALAPTAVNQQKFRFKLEGKTVRMKAGLGPYAGIDLGIARYHFEIGACAENFVFADSL